MRPMTNVTERIRVLDETPENVRDFDKKKREHLRGRQAGVIRVLPVVQCTNVQVCVSDKYWPVKFRSKIQKSATRNRPMALVPSIDEKFSSFLITFTDIQCPPDSTSTSKQCLACKS